MDVIVADLSGAMNGLVRGGPETFLVSMAISAVLVGIFCNHASHLLHHAMTALVISALAYGAFLVVQDLGAWQTLLIDQWSALMDMTFSQVLGAYLVMLVAITFVFMVRSLLIRR